MSARTVRLCMYCREKPVKVPDRNSMSMVKKVCGDCHGALLRGDLAEVLRVHRQRQRPSEDTAREEGG